MSYANSTQQTRKIKRLQKHSHESESKSQTICELSKTKALTRRNETLEEEEPNGDHMQEAARDRWAKTRMTFLTRTKKLKKKKPKINLKKAIAQYPPHKCSTSFETK
jgi:hypothetical protein